MACARCGKSTVRVFTVRAPDGRTWTYLTRGEAVVRAASVPGASIIEK